MKCNAIFKFASSVSAVCKRHAYNIFSKKISSNILPRAAQRLVMREVPILAKFITIKCANYILYRKVRLSYQPVLKWQVPSDIRWYCTWHFTDLVGWTQSCSDVQLHRACVAISTQWAPYKTSDCLHKNEGKNWAACREVGRSVLSGDTPAVQLTLSQQISPLVNILDRGKVFYYHFMGKIWSVIRLVGRPS